VIALGSLRRTANRPRVLNRHRSARHDRPGGETIDIALAKVPASGPEQKIGTIFVIPGGPGGFGPWRQTLSVEPRNAAGDGHRHLKFRRRSGITPGDPL
jgi:hypothetical protein